MRVVLLVSLVSLATSVASKEDHVLRRNRLYYGVTSDSQNSVVGKSDEDVLLEEDAFFLGRMLAGSFSTPTSNCDSNCPCCISSPEFLAAVDGFQGPPDSCYARTDADGSDIIALDLCETSTLAGFESGLTAYMSIDYANRGGTPTEPVYYCGDSSSDVDFVTEAEGAVCQDVIRSRVEQEGGVCDDVFECQS
jgi:hypothetical protein